MWQNFLIGTFRWRLLSYWQNEDEIFCVEKELHNIALSNRLDTIVERMQ